VENINNKEKKIFLIGYNKCATRSICNLLEQSYNIKSEQVHHHRKGEIASHIFSDIHNNVSILSRYPRINNVIAFADLENVSKTNGGLPIMANEYFKEIYACFPCAYYILNIRNVDDWLISRINHNASLGHHSYLKRWKKLYKIKDEEVIEMWRNSYIQHTQNVKNFFVDDRKRSLLIYDIDNDNPSKIVSFLSDSYVFPHTIKMPKIK
jgi:hypothetical protein